jgi:hypothetical protein
LGITHNRNPSAVSDQEWDVVVPYRLIAVDTPGNMVMPHVTRANEQGLEEIAGTLKREKRLRRVLRKSHEGRPAMTGRDTIGKSSK